MCGSVLITLTYVYHICLHKAPVFFYKKKNLTFFKFRYITLRIALFLQYVYFDIFFFRKVKRILFVFLFGKYFRNICIFIKYSSVDLSSLMFKKNVYM